jgi:hypothetical protein
MRRSSAAVEELPRFQECVTELVPIVLIDDLNPRQYDDEQDSFRENIAEHGLINAIVVAGVGERYKVVAGRRRLSACKQLSTEGRFATGDYIRSVILSEGTHEEIELSENIHRKEFDVFEEAELLENFGIKRGLKSAAAIARALNLKDRTVQRTMLVNGISPAIKDEYLTLTRETVDRWGYIPFKRTQIFDLVQKPKNQHEKAWLAMKEKMFKERATRKEKMEGMDPGSVQVEAFADQGDGQSENTSEIETRSAEALYGSPDKRRTSLTEEKDDEPSQHQDSRTKNALESESSPDRPRYGEFSREAARITGSAQDSEETKGEKPRMPEARAINSGDQNQEIISSEKMEFHEISDFALESLETPDATEDEDQVPQHLREIHAKARSPQDIEFHDIHEPIPAADLSEDPGQTEVTIDLESKLHEYDHLISRLTEDLYGFNPAVFNPRDLTNFLEELEVFEVRLDDLRKTVKDIREKVLAGPERIAEKLLALQSELQSKREAELPQPKVEPRIEKRPRDISRNTFQEIYRQIVDEMPEDQISRYEDRFSKTMELNAKLKKRKPDLYNQLLTNLIIKDLDQQRKQELAEVGR